MNQMRQHSGGGSHRRWVTAFLVAMAAISPAMLAAQQPPPPAPPASSVSPVPATKRAPGDTAAARDDHDLIAAATREYHASGVARTVIQGNFVTFPYGHAQPTLTCTVLRACVIELEPGEIVLSRISGDTERWEIGPAPAGPDGRTYHY